MYIYVHVHVHVHVRTGEDHTCFDKAGIPYMECHPRLVMTILAVLNTYYVPTTVRS